MTSGTRISICVAISLLAVIAAQSSSAQVERAEEQAAAPPAAAGAVPLERVIAAVAKRTGKKFIVDPRVRAQVSLVGQEATTIDYPTLLSLLRVYGFAAVEQAGYVQVMPDGNIRQQSLPVVSGKESYADSEFVNKIITVKSASAAQLVPILRPLLPQVAHLVALPCKNALLVTDVYSSVQRIEKIVRALDVGEPYTPPSCSADSPPRQQ
ncbi:MAG TPA: secretin N-terminal domain-containing protein [Steroidobacteraceae bacterium]|nr:secretin N-terminal domain-containing protein [Steroidobacteraceae bacterium]